MLTLDALLSAVSGKPDVPRLLRGFVPPPRFAGKDFESYHPRHPTQLAALDRLREVPDEIGQARAGRGVLAFLRRNRESGRGIYLDGGFGVGKTHLLAALWHRSAPPKAYLGFDELMYFIGLVGTPAAAAAFAGHRLIAVDEWELDDPGNLTMALAFLRVSSGSLR